MPRQKPIIPLEKRLGFIEECRTELKEQGYDLVLDLKEGCHRFKVNGTTYAVLGEKSGGIIIDCRGMFEENNETEEHKKVRICLEKVLRNYVKNIDLGLVSERPIPYSPEEKAFLSCFPGHTSDYPPIVRT